MPVSAVANGKKLSPEDFRVAVFRLVSCRSRNAGEIFYQLVEVQNICGINLDDVKEALAELKKLNCVTESVPKNPGYFIMHEEASAPDLFAEEKIKCIRAGKRWSN